MLEDELADLLPRLDRKITRDDDKIEEAVRRAIRQSVQAEIGKKPEVSVIISRLVAE
jgi:ribonuclease J